MAGISKKRVKKDGKEIIKYVITYRDITGRQHTYGSYDKVSDARKDLDKFDTKINSSKILTIGEITKLFIDSRSLNSFWHIFTVFTNFIKFMITHIILEFQVVLFFYGFYEFYKVFKKMWAKCEPKI